VPGADPVDDWVDRDWFGMDNVPFDAVRRSAQTGGQRGERLAQGGGLLIAPASDVALAVDTATFRAPSVPGIADMGSRLPPRRSDRKSPDMLFTGRVVTAGEAWSGA